MIELELAGQNQKELLRNLFNIYQGELSLYCNEFQTVDQNGYFDYSTVDEYFTEDEAILPYLIKKNQQVIGFCILTRPPYVKAGSNYCIQEFYMIGYYRGKGTATEAAEQILRLHQGRYCLQVLSANKRAQSFWKKIAEHCGEEIRESANEIGMVLEFHTKERGCKR